jgi:hypothetical protein
MKIAADTIPTTDGDRFVDAVRQGTRDLPGEASIIPAAQRHSIQVGIEANGKTWSRIFEGLQAQPEFVRDTISRTWVP